MPDSPRTATPTLPAIKATTVIITASRKPKKARILLLCETSYRASNCCAKAWSSARSSASISARRRCSASLNMAGLPVVLIRLRHNVRADRGWVESWKCPAVTTVLHDDAAERGADHVDPVLPEHAEPSWPRRPFRRWRRHGVDRPMPAVSKADPPVRRG